VRTFHPIIGASNVFVVVAGYVVALIGALFKAI
jgi:hypothetical protein